MSRAYKKILSLDGGGSWALIQAAALGKLYGADTSGRDILKRFDLVIANSGGSLVAGALAAGMSPEEIRNKVFLDEEERRKIFVDNWSAFSTRIIGFGPRYKASDKLEGLNDVLTRMSKCPGIIGTTPLNQLSAGDNSFPDFVITAFDYDRQRAVYFRSNSASLASSDPQPNRPCPTLAEALHASSNAPVNYFDRPAVFKTIYKGKRFWDGGVAGLNNPVLAGVTEALANGTSANAIRALSIGTASVVLPSDDCSSPQPPPPIALKKKSSWLIPDIKRLAKAIIDDPPDAASYIAFQVLHGGEIPQHSRLIRLNPLIQPIRNNLHWCSPAALHSGYPDSFGETAFEYLVNLDMDAIEQIDVELIAEFCDLWLADLVPNQPIQSRDDLGCHIGHPTFSMAEAGTRAIGLAPPAPPGGAPVQDCENW